MLVKQQEGISKVESILEHIMVKFNFAKLKLCDQELL
jgi:hypothetical protein